MYGSFHSRTGSQQPEARTRTRIVLPSSSSHYFIIGFCSCLFLCFACSLVSLSSCLLASSHQYLIMVLLSWFFFLLLFHACIMHPAPHHAAYKLLKLPYFYESGEEWLWGPLIRSNFRRPTSRPLVVLPPICFPIISTRRSRRLFGSLAKVSTFII